MWEQYFKGKVYGIDCDVKPHGGIADLTPMIQDHNIFILNAEDPKAIEWYFGGVKFDVIIEDAGHEINQQINLCNIWRPYLAEGGIYIIEDVQDIEKDEKRFFDGSIKNWTEVSVIDLRKEKGRYDDVLIIIK